jgi:hypothetical protein
MKKSPIKTHTQQSVFNFANQHSYPPAINARIWSCSRLPAQDDHPTGSCFAARLPTWFKTRRTDPKNPLLDGAPTNASF